MGKTFEQQKEPYRSNMQRTIRQPFLCEEPADRFNLKRIADWRSRAVAFEVKRFVGIEIARPLIRSSNGTFLPIRIRVCDAARATVPDKIKSIDISMANGEKRKIRTH